MRQIVIRLSEEMYGELKAAVAHEPMAPETWAEEAVEAALATRRLPFVRPSNSEVRLPGAERAIDHRPMFAECRAAGPMRAADVPTLRDLESISEIL